MRFILIILDGEGALPGGDFRSGLARASTPHLDRLAGAGRVGAFVPGAPSFAGGFLTLLGIDPHAAALVGPALLRAAELGLPLGAGDWALRGGLVSAPGDEHAPMLGLARTSGDESRVLRDDLIAHWRGVCPATVGDLEFYPDGDGWLVLDRSGVGYAGTELVDPREGEGEPWIEHLPEGGPAGSVERLCTLISVSRGFLADHPVNAARREHGLEPAGLAWFWDAGCADGARGSLERGATGRGALLFADAGPIVGAARLLGLDFEPAGELPGLARRVLGSDRPLIAIALSAGIERVDRELLAPLLEGLPGLGERDAPWRVLVALSHAPGDPGHPVGAPPAPFALGGGWVRGLIPRRLHEGPLSDLIVDPGCELLEYVLRGGLRGAV